MLPASCYATPTCNSCRRPPGSGMDNQPLLVPVSWFRCSTTSAPVSWALRYFRAGVVHYFHTFGMHACGTNKAMGPKQHYASPASHSQNKLPYMVDSPQRTGLRCLNYRHSLL